MLTFSNLQTIVDGGTWDQLKGQPENDVFDCKKTLYDLSVDGQKQELAKDVSSFANAEGGFLLLGIEVSKSTTHPGDEVATLRPFSRDLLDPKQYVDIVNNWIVPKVEGMTVEWHAEVAGGTHGFGVIRIPPQPEGQKPFVIAKVVLETGRRRDMLVGFVQRKRDTSQPATPSDVAKWLSDGRNYQTQIETRLDEISARLAGTGDRRAVAPAEGPSDDEVKERISASVQATGLINRPHYVLAAVPSRGTSASTILESGPNTITWTLENPPVLRYAGWSLETLDNARIVEGRFRQLTNGDRKVLRLYRDGTLVFAAAADSEFLGWGESLDEFKRSPRLVSLALIEVTYLFCLLYAEVLKDLTEMPPRATIRFRLGGMHHAGTAQPVHLNPYAVNTHGFRLNDDVGAAPQDAAEDCVEVDTSAFNSSAVAYRIIEEIYLWFGLEPSHIPYSREVNGNKEINPQAIVASH